MMAEDVLKEKSAMCLTVRDVLEATGGTLVRGKAAGIFQDISTDSRKLSEGHLFICLQGDRFDGHRFLANAATAGAAGFVVQGDAGVDLQGLPEERPVIQVKDTLESLGDIARFWRKKQHVPVIAITGSSGKTTTKEMTAGILNLTKKVLKTEGNLNNRIGLPLTLLGLREGHDVAVVEMGTNMPGEIGRLTHIAEPSIGVITNIGVAHLEKLQSLKLIREEKGALFRNMDSHGTAVINGDDEALLLLGRRWQGKRITFSWRNPADVTAVQVRKGRLSGMDFMLQIGREERPIHLQAAGDHNLSNALAAAAVAHAFGTDPDSIRQGLEAFRPVPGRFVIHSLQNGICLIDDTYNANPLSVREALKTLDGLRGTHDSVVILGDMLELGNQAVAWHREMGRLIAGMGVKTLFLIGEHRQDTAAGAMEHGMADDRILFYEQPDRILTALQRTLKPGDWVLVKGSRKMKMEGVVAMMMERFGLAREDAA